MKWRIYMRSINSVTVHLLRGGVGIALLLAALYLAHGLPVIALLLGAGSLFAFGGCPTCWIAGLCEVGSRKNEVGQGFEPVPTEGTPFRGIHQ